MRYLSGILILLSALILVPSIASAEDHTILVGTESDALIFEPAVLKISPGDNINLKIPLGTFTCVTGVSGSGKSSLIIDTLYKRLDEYFNKSLSKDESRFNIKGINNIDKVIS